MYEDIKINVEYWDIDRLIPYIKNPRKNDHAVEKAAKIIKRVGFRIPILAMSTGLIIDGHLRLKVAQKLNMKMIPVSNCDDMTEDEIKALRLSVNQMANLADWDLDLLDEELADLELAGFDKEELGFDNLNSDLADWESELQEPNGEKNLDGIMGIIKISCPQDAKVQITSFIKQKLIEGGFGGVDVA